MVEQQTHMTAVLKTLFKERTQFSKCSNNYTKVNLYNRGMYGILKCGGPGYRELKLPLKKGVQRITWQKGRGPGLKIALKCPKKSNLLAKGGS